MRLWLNGAMLSNMVPNGKMMTPIGPDIMQPGSVMLYQRRRSQRIATERKRPKKLRQDVAKRPLLEIRGHREQKKARVAPKTK